MKPLFVIIIHWLIVLFIVVAFLTGQRITSDHPGDLLHINSDWLPGGLVFSTHIATGQLLIVFYLSYLVTLISSGRLAKLLNPTGKATGSDSSHNINRYLILLGLLLLLLIITTGLINYTESKFSTSWVSDVHYYLAWMLVMYPFVHVWASYNSGGINRLITIFKASNKKLIAGSVSLIVFAFISFVFLNFSSSSIVVEMTKDTPTIDGLGNDVVWTRAEKSIIHTRAGNDDSGGFVAVSVQAVHDGERIYMLLRWPDKSKSFNHLPLTNSSGQWRVTTDGYERDDERTFYEDKLSIMLSNNSVFDAVNSFHFGNSHFSDKSVPAPRHGRGYHYTKNNLILDVWHWKALRTDGFFQADDNFFGAAIKVRECDQRYKAGYQQDPSNGGGYSQNVTYFTTAEVTPLRLPSSSRFTYRVEDEAKKVHVSKLMRVSDSYPYHNDSNENLAANTRIPFVLSHGPIQGDRGHVGAKGVWADGYWSVEFSRALNTFSPYDVEIKNGTYLWLAAFNHAQTRHSYHLWPLRMKLTAVEPLLSSNK